MTDTDNAPLSIFEERGIVTRFRTRRTFISTLIGSAILFLLFSTQILPGAVTGIIFILVLFLSLLFLASLMKLLFMRRSRLDIYPDHFVYQNLRRNKSQEHLWGDLTNINIEVIREAEPIDMSYPAPAAAQAYYGMFRRFFRTFVGDPPNYTLLIQLQNRQTIKMLEIAGDYRFLLKQLPDLVVRAWTDAIERRIQMGTSSPIGEFTITNDGVRIKKREIPWRNLIMELEPRTDDKLIYQIKDKSVSPGLMRSNTVGTLSYIPGQVLIIITQKQGAAS